MVFAMERNSASDAKPPSGDSGMPEIEIRFRPRRTWL
jgi:hypothetical protein